MKAAVNFVPALSLLASALLPADMSRAADAPVNPSCRRWNKGSIRCSSSWMP